MKPTPVRSEESKEGFAQDSKHHHRTHRKARHHLRAGGKAQGANALML